MYQVLHPPVSSAQSQEGCCSWPRGQQHHDFTSPQWMEVRDSDSKDHPICRSGLTPSSHWLSSALLPWNMTLAKWKPHEVIDHAETLETVLSSSMGGGLQGQPIRKQPLHIQNIMNSKEGAARWRPLRELLLAPHTSVLAPTVFSPWALVGLLTVPATSQVHYGPWLLHCLFPLPRNTLLFLQNFPQKSACSPGT